MEGVVLIIICVAGLIFLRSELVNIVADGVRKGIGETNPMEHRFLLPIEPMEESSDGR